MTASEPGAAFTSRGQISGRGARPLVGVPAGGGFEPGAPTTQLVLAVDERALPTTGSGADHGPAGGRPGDGADPRPQPTDL
jgi:hypothetical protein